MQSLINLWNDTGIAHIEGGQALMMLVAFGMLYLAIKKGFEPLLLLPIAVGTLMINIPGAGLGLVCCGSGDPFRRCQRAGGIRQAVWSGC